MDDEYNPALNAMEHIDNYYMPVFLCFFLLGNSLSVCVLFCTKLRYKSSSIYLGALAMSDIGVLVMTFMKWITNWMEITITKEYCWEALLFSLNLLFRSLSVWIVIAFTVQRYVVIKWPLLRRSLCTVNRAKIIVIGLAGLAVLYSIPWFIIQNIRYTNINAHKEKKFDFFKIFDINDTIIPNNLFERIPSFDMLNITYTNLDADEGEEIHKWSLDINDTIMTIYLPENILLFIISNITLNNTNLDADKEKNFFYWLGIFNIIHAIITCFLPATMIVIFNALIVYNIRKQNCIRRNMISSFSASNKNTQSFGNEASHIKVTKMLVIISTLFICLNVPMHVIYLYYSSGICGTYCYLLLFISQLLLLANYGMDVVLYCATGKNFRRELIRMFTKSSDTRRNADMEMENFRD
nr:PREDICTED: uncharacterized protein LOC105675254 [Linepithema humile]